MRVRSDFSRFVHLAGRLVSLSLVSVAACAGGNGAHEDIGEATAQIAQVPEQVSCVAINIAGARSVERRFDVVAGQSTLLSLAQLPTGNVIFTAFAYPMACPLVTQA